MGHGKIVGTRDQHLSSAKVCRRIETPYHAEQENFLNAVNEYALYPVVGKTNYGRIDGTVFYGDTGAACICLRLVSSKIPSSFERRTGIYPWDLSIPSSDVETGSEKEEIAVLDERWQLLKLTVG